MATLKSMKTYVGGKATKRHKGDPKNGPGTVAERA